MSVVFVFYTYIPPNIFRFLELCGISLATNVGTGSAVHPDIAFSGNIHLIIYY